jgi:putative Ig domain-containing protein
MSFRKKQSVLLLALLLSVFTISAQNNFVRVDNCDAATGWNSGGNTISVDASNFKEGTGCVQSIGSGVDELHKVFSTPFSTTATGVLQFWYYVSDVTAFTSGDQVELSSSGASDVQEYNWSLASYGLVNGWNFISLNISSAGISGGPVNLNNINWFRIYHSNNGSSIITKIDDIRLTGSGGALVPLLSGANSVSALRSNAFTYNTVAYNTPIISYAASGLAPGLSINTSTGVISGTPTTAGTYNATISATNATGTSNKTLTINVTGPNPPVINLTSDTVSCMFQTAFAYTISASNSPTSYAASGLPLGLSINTSTGSITGTSIQIGRFPLTISATNLDGSDTRILYLNIKSPTAASVTGKVICGYQGWFNYAGDGSPIGHWVHWTGQSQPAPGYGNISFDIYPAVDEYNSSSLSAAGTLGNFGDGTTSKLFSAYKADVTDKHFSWMQQNGIDGVALQRFAGNILDPNSKSNMDSVHTHAMLSAEKYGRVFYEMYDDSGLDSLKLDSMETDWQNDIVENLHLTSSPYYLRQNGKPVVCIWGIGYTGRAGTTKSLELINWFKSHGCYVIGGVPHNWRTGDGDSQPNFLTVYHDFDMISPWAVGDFGDVAGADSYKSSRLVPDLADCTTNGIAYQPVMFAGFTWANWNGNVPNDIPRAEGTFMWRQAYNIQQTGIGQAYVAMFDEYDEGTAIAKAADSYYAIPNNQWFLTSSADGAYCSGDFYMRLVGEETKIIKGIDAAVTSVTVANSAGPIWFRSGVEQKFYSLYNTETKYDAFPTWTNTVDPSTANSNVVGYNNTGNPTCVADSGVGHIGNYGLQYAAYDNSTGSSHCYLEMFKVVTLVDINTRLSFWTNPQNTLGRNVSVDLICTDGTALRNVNAKDTTGLLMHPGTARGTIGTWGKTVCYIGQWLEGKTIDRIVIAYDNGAPTVGNILSYIDDLSLDEGILDTTATICSGSSTISYVATAPATGNTYQWQVDNGTGYSNILNNATYSGATANTLVISNITSSMYGYKYQCQVSNNGVAIPYTPVYTLKCQSTWTGTVSTAWENGANWSCGTVPDANTDVIINAGTTNYPVVSSNAVCHSATVAANASLIITGTYKLDIKGLP